MNLAALPELLLSWVKGQGVALLQSDKASSNPPATFQSGQQYNGKVVDTLANGRHLVRVGNQMLDMNLPGKTQPGDSVRLTYLNAAPRPTFLLNQAAVSPVQQVRISNTAQQVNTLLRLAQPPAALPAAPATSAGTSAVTSPATSPATSAGMAGQSVAARGTPLLPEMAKASTTVPARGAPPLLDTAKATAPAAVSTANLGPAGSSAMVAASARPIAANVVVLQNYSAALQPTTTALTGSNTGLLGQAVDAPRASASASTTLSANTLVELPAASRHMLPVRLSQTLSESGLFYESHLAKWSKGTLSLETILREPLARLGQETQASVRLAELGGMPEEAARMAGRQLQMLEGAPFLWQGLAWPGQTMAWQIHEEAAGDGHGDAGEGSAEWVTELKITLPRLGEVHAQLALAGANLRLRLLAGDAATREALAAALPQLAKGFEASGLQPSEMQVEALPAAAGHG